MAPGDAPGVTTLGADRDELVAALEGVPARLRAAVAAATAGEAGPATARPIEPGAWTPAEVVRHLIAVESEVHQGRLADLRTTDDPQWDWVEPPPWTGEPELSLGALLDRFTALRAATLATVAALDEPDWARTGTHARLGVFDVRALLVNAIEHDEHHLASLARPTGD